MSFFETFEHAPKPKPEQCRAHLLKLLREYRGSYLYTQEVSDLVTQSGAHYPVRDTLEALHSAGEVSKMQTGRGARLAYSWAVPA